MEREYIKKEVTEIFRTVLNNKDLVLTDATSAEDVEEWDSFIHITLIAAIEERFHLKFKLREIVEMQKVGEIINIVFRKLDQKDI